MQVINQRIVRVFLKESAGSDSASQYWFTVGSMDSFERKLEQARFLFCNFFLLVHRWLHGLV
jgi:hypothetical protein